MTKIIDPSLPVPPKELGLRGPAVMKWQIQQLLDINKEIKAGAESDAPTIEAVVTPVATVPATVAEPTPNISTAYDASVDPLSWITEEVYEVHIVGRIYGVRGRRSVTDLRGTQEKTMLSADRTAPWVSCPFDYSHPDPDYQRQLEILNKMWWIFTLGREFAEEVYSGYDPIPERAVIAVENYQGRDRKGRVLGPKTPASSDPLREYTRWVLQTNPKTMWLNDDAGHYVKNGFITKGFPNPYGHGVQVDEPQGRAAGHMDASEYVGGVVSS